jgi:ABC-2 type transport system ATP-binding protein
MIRTEQLTKHYGVLRAVDGVGFEVSAGEVLGFLGPNGAGKSTTMRMIAGFIAPTSGRASICGHDVESEPVKAKRCLGYLPEGAPSYGEMSVRGFLEFVADLRGLRGAQRRARLDYVFSRLQLEGVLEQSVETLSKGFRRRVGLAQAIVHDPPALVLDEPTDGLDPNQKHEVRSLINEMARDKIIVISTHILEEVDAVCTRAIIIASGRILADESPQALAARSRYSGAVSFRAAAGEDLVALRQALAAQPGVASVEVSERERRVTALPAPGTGLLAAVQQFAAARGVALADLRVEPGRLDEVFRRITT